MSKRVMKLIYLLFHMQQGVPLERIKEELELDKYTVKTDEICRESASVKLSEKVVSISHTDDSVTTPAPD